MKKNKRDSGLTIHLSNRWLYTLIALFVIAIISVGVYAVVDTSKGWHPANQIEGVCKSDGTGCLDESDPTVNAYIKNKGSCAAITGSANLCDGNDAVGVTSCSYTLSSCQYITTDRSDPSGIIKDCPSNKVMAGIIKTTIGSKQAVGAIRCCSISLSCS